MLQPYMNYFVPFNFASKKMLLCSGVLQSLGDIENGGF